jgi:hypothetical protein
MRTWIYVSLAIVGVLFGLASPLPIWPGPLIYRHLTPGIISAILIIISCLGIMKEGSRIVGVISLVYGALATVAGILFSWIVSLFGLGNPGSGSLTPVILLGSIIALVVGITSIILGFKTYKAKKQKPK